MSIDALGAAVSGFASPKRDWMSSRRTSPMPARTGIRVKILPQEALVVDGQTIGVRYGEIQRTIDASLLRDYNTQIGVESYYTTKQSFLSRLAATQGATDQETNLGARIGQLMDSFVSLSLPPTAARRKAKPSMRPRLWRVLSIPIPNKS